MISLITRALHSPEKSSVRHVENSGSNLHFVFVVCVIGLLLSLYCIVRFPELGAIIAQYNQL